MSQFPLYDSLLSSTEEKDLTKSEKKEFDKLICKMDQQGHKFSYVLIKMYAQNETEYKNYTLPFDGKYFGINIQFDLEIFPFKLKQMLFKFIKAHIKTMKENEENSNRANIVAQSGIVDFDKILN